MMWEVLFCLLKGRKGRIFIVWEDCRSGNRKETPLDIFCPLASVWWNLKKVAEAENWKWEPRKKIQSVPYGITEGRDVGLFLMSRPLSVSEEMSGGAGWGLVTIKAQGCPCAETLRSCLTLPQLFRWGESRNLFSSGDSPAEAVWLRLGDVTGICRPEQKGLKGEEQQMQRRWRPIGRIPGFSGPASLPCPDYWLRSQNVPFRKLPFGFIGLRWILSSCVHSYSQIRTSVHTPILENNIEGQIAW